jgi:hypothetical protein
MRLEELAEDEAEEDSDLDLFRLKSLLHDFIVFSLSSMSLSDVVSELTVPLKNLKRRGTLQFAV